MRLVFTAAPWLLLLLANNGSSVVDAQLRGESSSTLSTQGLDQDLKVNDTSVSIVHHHHHHVDNRESVAIDMLHMDSNSTSSSPRRNLSSEHKMFYPLNCNTGCSPSSWTYWKTENYNTNSKITIPCGKCVVMNYDASERLYLPHGLNIEGTLRFDNHYKVTIKTPFVHVQGHLIMNAQTKVTGEPNIKFLLTGTSELMTSFVPADNNKFACSTTNSGNPSPCFVGKKAFVVAGGKVTIRGVPNNTTTWTNLYDISRDEMPSPTAFSKLPTSISPMCQLPYMEDNFSTTSNLHRWTGGYGALFEVSNGHFLVSDRKDPLEHGPTFDLRRIRDCLVSGQDYLFRARIKLTKAGVADGTLTTCAKTDTFCLWLHSNVKTTTGQLGRRIKVWEDQKHAWRYGQWQDFYATVRYTDAELNAQNIYQILQLRGPERGVDIAMDDVRFSLPPPGAVPDPSNVCGGNIVLNGDAQLDTIHPYPIDNFGGVLTVKEADGKQYFHHYARSSDNDSLYYSFDALGCLVANGKYKVSAKIRVGSSSLIKSRIKLVTLFTNAPAIQRTIADCDGSSSSSWTSCEASFPLPKELITGNVTEIRLQFETMGAPNADMDIDDVKLELLEGSATSIVVPDNGILGSWDAGAEILITSHTLDYNDAQVRRLVSAPQPANTGYVKLDLDSAIIPATTLLESPTFAVEVALLSRNIVFEGDTDDADSLMGAHFVVMHTPNVAQRLEGVEFRNFGQQGVLGKYPIHFHLCGRVSGSIVSKNSIRLSNQRCIVVHGTHSLNVTDNVAFDTAGHCFMTEDGGEIDNVFQDNLGASTHAVLSKNVLGPLDSDHLPSTFWCSNPQNEWIGNVAAGSRNNGFWFELLTKVRGPTAEMALSQGMNPRFMNLKQFRDNVAHSNGQHGLRTYPEGFMPKEEAVFLNTRSYRNRQEGVFVHNSRNLAVQGGVLADNRIQFDFDRGAENIRLDSASLIGVSDEYKYVLRTQPEAPSHSSVTGIELHGFTLDVSNDGAVIRNVSFSGFEDTSATHTALIEVDDDTSHGNFDYLTTLQGMTVANADKVSPMQFDFTGAMANGIDNIYLTDIGSGMRPNGTAASPVSTVMSNTTAMSKFIDTSKCQTFPERAYMYCSHTCLRTIVLAVPPSMTDDFVLRVNPHGNANNFIDIAGKFDDEEADSWIRRRRYFSVALPSDLPSPSGYMLTFFRGGNMDWPTGVEVTFEKPQCHPQLQRSLVPIEKPVADASICGDLIKNGGMEMSANAYPYWLQHETRLQLAPQQGVSGSTALSEIGQSAPSIGLIGQYLDTRCLTRGLQYEVRASVKLTRNGAPFACDTNNCPKARLKIRTPDDPDGLSFSEFNMDIVSFFKRPYNKNDWNVLQGVFTADSRIEDGASVLFFVERGRSGVKMLIDNVSVSLISPSLLSPGQCNELVFNGGFADGQSSFWYSRFPSTTMTIRNGSTLKMSGRNALTHSPEQDIRTGCMTTGERYIATARVRLENTDGSFAGCQPSRTSNLCPRMRLRSMVDIGLPSNGTAFHDGGSIAVTDHGPVSGWYIMSGIFTANDFDGRADKSTLMFDQVSAQKDFVIDDVSIKRLPKNCNNLIFNGNAEYGPSPSFWTHWVVNGGAKISLVSAGNNNRAFKVQRQLAGDGMHQYIDPRCLVAGTTWKFVARMRLVNKSNGQGASCEPSETRQNFNKACPPIRIGAWTAGVKQSPEQVLYMTNRLNWSAGGYNTYQVEFTVDSALASSDRVSFGIRGYNADWDLFLDNMALIPM